MIGQNYSIQVNNQFGHLNRNSSWHNELMEKYSFRHIKAERERKKKRQSHISAIEATRSGVAIDISFLFSPYRPLPRWIVHSGTGYSQSAQLARLGQPTWTLKLVSAAE